MSIVVAYTADDYCQNIKIVEGSKLDKLAVTHNVMGHLQDISCMDIIMILNLLKVTSCDFIQKSVQDLLVNLRHRFEKIHVFHNFGGDNLECILSANFLERCEHVENLFLNVNKNIGCRFKLLNFGCKARISANSLSFCTL